MFEREFVVHEESWNEKKREGDNITMLFKILKIKDMP